MRLVRARKGGFEAGSKQYRILIVGCGELGSRHLQAVAKLSEVEEIQVVDPRLEALQFGKERLGEIERGNPGMTVRWLSSLQQVSPGSDLCVVATRAKERPLLVREAAELLGVRLFLLEKSVAPSIGQVEELREFMDQRGLSAWVNLKTRCYPFHRRAKKRLDSREPLVFCVLGGNLGLANNGIHAADLFAFYTGSTQIEDAGSSIDPILHPSKREGDLFDLSGILHGITENGSRFALSYMRDTPVSEVCSLQSPRYRFIVDHFQRWAYESDADSGWQWRSVPFEGDLRVSVMTQGFVREILAAGACGLPTLEESLISHRFILEGLRPHFNRLMEREGDLCPVP